jgi:hypothetical protein
MAQRRIDYFFVRNLGVSPSTKSTGNSPNTELITDSSSTQPIADSPSREPIADSLIGDDSDSLSDRGNDNLGNSLQINGSNGCNCSRCTNFNVAHQPEDLEGSKAPHGQQKSYSRSIRISWYTNTHGSVCAHHLTKYIVMCAAVQRTRA